MFFRLLRSHLIEYSEKIFYRYIYFDLLGKMIRQIFKTQWQKNLHYAVKMQYAITIFDKTKRI